MPRIERIGAGRSFTGAGRTFTGGPESGMDAAAGGTRSSSRPPATALPSRLRSIRLRDVLVGVLRVEQLVAVHDQRRDLLPCRVQLHRRKRLRAEPRVALDRRVESAGGNRLQPVTLAVDRDDLDVLPR